ncbi:MAG: response regulator [Candidatus Delongbacteria bacterium]|nr:response regulator [Candidatus Delongbacteria bacterium]MBN2834358.1 response regulator [Candidatus Delongbacteria bacterium]
MKSIFLILMIITTLKADELKCLILNSYSKDNYLSKTYDNILIKTLNDNFNEIEILEEYLSFDLASGESYEDDLYVILSKRYMNLKPDFIITIGDDAFHFMRMYKHPYFSSTPIFFLNVKVVDKMMLLGFDDFYGVQTITDYSNLIHTIFRLYPPKKEIITFSEKTQSGVLALSLFNKNLKQIYPEMKITNINLTNSGRFIDYLSNNSIPMVLLESSGSALFTSRILNLIDQKSKVPIFTSLEYFVGKGAIGGDCVNLEKEVSTVINLIKEVSVGYNDIKNLTMIENSFKTVYDQPSLLKRYIQTSKLDKDTEIINKPSDFFKVNKYYILIVMIIIVILVFFSFFLYRGKRKLFLSENSLRLISEEINQQRILVQSILNSLNSVIIGVDENLKIFISNKDFIESEDLYLLLPFLKTFHNEIENSINNRISYSFTKKIDKNSDNVFDLFLIPFTIRNQNKLIIRLDNVTDFFNQEKQLIQAQKMESIGTLAGGIAHDFNNVLTGILGTTEIIQFKLEKNIEIKQEELKKYISIIDNAADNASNVVKQLLSLARKQDTQKMKCDIRNAINNVLKLLERTIEKNIEVKTVFEISDCFSLIDQQQIEQVLLNICINSIHSMTIMRDDNESYGGILTISIELVSSEEIIRSKFLLNEGKKYWKLNIEDTGVGIPEEIRSKIFDPFFSTKGKDNGTGLGLSMVYRIIESHEGHIDVYSEVGIGTRFSIYLPVEEDSEVFFEKKNILNFDFGKIQKILVIDDDNVVLDTVCRYLDLLGISYYSATNGKEGLDKFIMSNAEIDLIILDMAMPVMSGKEAFYKMKEINNNTKILLTSGFRYDKRVDELIKIGVDGFIQKPYSIRDLSEKIGTLLEL